MAKLYLIRHGEPEKRGVLLGQQDCGLSPRGLWQARQKLQYLPVAVVYSSPLRRALETVLQMRFKFRLVILDELKDIHYGAWEGLRWDEIEAAFPELARSKLRNWPAVTPPEAEPWPEFQARVRRALEVILHGPLPAAVVAHDAVNAVLAQALCDINPMEFHQDYCEVRSYELPARRNHQSD